MTSIWPKQKISITYGRPSLKTQDLRLPELDARWTPRRHNGVLDSTQTPREIRCKTRPSEALFKKMDLPGADLEQAKHFARAAARAIQQGLLGYSLMVARRRGKEN